MPDTCCEKFTAFLVKLWALVMFSLGYVFMRFFDPNIVTMIEYLMIGPQMSEVDK